MEQVIKSTGIAAAILNKQPPATLPPTTQLVSERENTHGVYTLTAEVAHRIKDAVAWGDNKGLHSYMRESLDMIATKMARIVSGDCYQLDHWQDIQGYAELVIKEIKKQKGL